MGWDRGLAGTDKSYLQQSIEFSKYVPGGRKDFGILPAVSHYAKFSCLLELTPLPKKGKWNFDRNRLICSARKSGVAKRIAIPRTL